MKSIRGIIGIMAVFIVTIMGLFVAIVYFRPLAKPLSINTFPTSTMDVAQVGLLQQAATAVPDKKAAICGMNGSIMILNLGVSTKLPSRPIAAESIRLVRIDVDQTKVMVFTLPRDLVVNTPALTEKYKITQLQLGDIYSVVFTAEQS